MLDPSILILIQSERLTFYGIVNLLDKLLLKVLLGVDAFDHLCEVLERHPALDCIWVMK